MKLFLQATFDMKKRLKDRKKNNKKQSIQII